MGQPLDERRCHLRVTKNVSPVSEAQIGCDDDTGASVEAAEQMEQQGATRCAEGEITGFIKDHKIQAEQPVGNLSGAAGGLFVFERIDGGR
ncbi:hypothetical protein MSKU9_1656 [Komagataeibacter diospyri]|uniref:Uncharacterized protein n=1 Tax=Komagataeibacter diospyri TaxID=1932662 RepID=A0A4P5NV97_9PROT|nr:hypothetical protein MSKU9_1656 [Komagataeibacter diospyri]